MGTNEKMNVSMNTRNECGTISVNNNQRAGHLNAYDGGWRLWLSMIVLMTLARSSALGADVGASLKVGTTGLGADVTVGVSDQFNVRAGLSWLSLTFEPDDEEGDDENITIKLRLQTIPLLGDWHPFAGNFRVSGGLMLNDNNVSLAAAPGDEIEFNEVDYRVESFSMDISFNQFSPYLGIGYGNAAKEGRRLVFALDLGIMYHGAPKVSARAIASDPAQQSNLDRDLDIEIADLRDDASAFRIYPVMSFGLSYRF